ncbi:hypothetical protein [Variovorax saccharolyticus]|uniref:hypothetical protein n=1 Tax=Variovorax saccharolyticus TaxID=3053516 RepID=UPI00257878D8|nr:hypothetical protein [Variovorax sp. J22R187]MDM0018186.1 hypothetical protein [Variovorax sp. J22R187]
MVFQIPQSELVGGCYAKSSHFAQAVGLPGASLNARIHDGSLPPLPPPLDLFMGGQRVWAEDDLYRWIKLVDQWKSELPARRAAERAAAKARQEQMYAELRAKEDAEREWSREQLETSRHTQAAVAASAEESHQQALASAARTEQLAEMGRFG